MTERPKAVTVIGWFLRVGGILGMVFALPYALWGQDLFGQYWTDSLLRLRPVVIFLWVFFSSLLCLLCGNGILKGRAWARILAVAYGVVATVIAAFLYKGNPLFWLNLIGDGAFILIIWFFLYRASATAFFKSGPLSP